MDKNKIIDFFNFFAPAWDSSMDRREDVIADILSLAGVSEGAEVLDVACGTGVLFPDYIKYGANVTGIDISPEMVKIAKEKFPVIEIICADAECCSFSKSFDVIMIHNAFPHFPDGEKLIKNLCKFLREGGRFSIAHSMSEKELERCHSGSAKDVSLPLPHTEELSLMMSPYLDIDVKISDSRMYMVSGVKKLS